MLADGRSKNLERVVSKVLRRQSQSGGDSRTGTSRASPRRVASLTATANARGRSTVLCVGMADAETVVVAEIYR